ncbi:helix-turn-helix domain-containing protein [Oceanitalea stevensii]|nr:helix-turn-helix domain-containing protein [Oceanitalea stevensii]
MSSGRNVRRGYCEQHGPSARTDVADSLTLDPAGGECEKMAEGHEVLTTEEAAALLRVSTKTVLALARDGSLPGEKVGRAWRFLRSDVLAVVRGSKDTPNGVGD